MIYSLSGTLVSKTPSSAVISCSGVGFYVTIPTSAYAALPETGAQAMLYTQLNVKEDAFELYGFASERDKEAFVMLTSVSGVGPKSAISILSLYDADRVALMIASGDHKAFTACSGVGPKLAQRLVLELKDKVKDWGAFSGSVQDNVAVSAVAGGEAVSALVALGFSASEAASAVSKLPQELPLEEMITAALKSLAAR